MLTEPSIERIVNLSKQITGVNKMEIIHPPHSEKILEKSLIDPRRNPIKGSPDYENILLRNLFYGLNKDDGAATFSLTAIDEASAFTVDIKDCLIIPRQLVIDIINGEPAPKDLIRSLFGHAGRRNLWGRFVSFIKRHINWSK